MIRLRPVRSVVAAGVLAACAGCASARASDPSPSPSPEHVKTVRAQHGRVSPTMRISGVIAPHRQIGVSSALNEPILEIRVREGDRVRAGQVLAVLQTDDLQAQLASAQETANEGSARSAQQAQQALLNGVGYRSQVVSANAALAQAESALRGALTDRARYAQLYRSGYVSQQVLAQQNVVIQQDAQAVDAARALVRQAQQAASVGTSSGGLEATQVSAARSAAAAASLAVEGLRRQIARATIVAPSDGVIEAINANVGEYPSGRQLFTLHDDGTKYAMLAASSSEAVRVRPGQDVSVLLADGTIHAPGKVEALLDQLAPGSTNYTLKVRVGNTRAPLLAGMPVVGVVHLAAVDGVLVPTSAFSDAMRKSVYVVSGGKAHERQVNDLAEDGEHAVVRGLPEGARVVTDGQGGVSDGDEVAQ